MGDDANVVDSSPIDPALALSVIFGKRRWAVIQGDCVEVLDRIPSSSIDSIVTDPPAGIGFMGREWDGDKGGRDSWIAWLTRCMREARRVLRPGGHALVWALPRTSHWTAMALELAGFEIRDRITHLFGEGYAKSLDMVRGAIVRAEKPGATEADLELVDWMKAHRDGFGTALKPAAEDWWLVRKPMSGTILETVREHGTGALNLDGCRVAYASPEDFAKHAADVAAIKARGGPNTGWKNSSDLSGVNEASVLGRWPAHVVVSHGPLCKPKGLRKVKAFSPWTPSDRDPSTFTGAESSPVHHADADGTETVVDWECSEGCPAKLLERQTGEDGGAARYFTQLPFDDEILDFEPFFYAPKPARGEREDGCAHLPAKSITGRAPDSAGAHNPRAGTGRRGLRHNYHPTVKSKHFIRWCCRLITPPAGLVLDLFAGSFTTGVACSAERFRFIGIDSEPGYCAIGVARIVSDAPLLNFGGGR